MPEGRMIKKVISESKKLGALPSDSARLLYTWLIPWLDVEGRHSADPEIIKGHVFPKIKSMTIRKIERLIHELNEGRLIILYVCDGETYLQFKKTLQKIDPTREAKTTILDPKKGQIIKPTHANSGVAHENSSTSKVNESKVKVNESKVNSSCLEKVPNEVDIRLTQLLIDLMLENDSKSYIIQSLTEKRQKEWINQCRLLREKDGRTEEEIEMITRWCQKDSFWKGNILSMPTLREKFSQLWLKAKKTSFAGIQDWLKKRRQG